MVKNLYTFTGSSGVGKSTLLEEIDKWDNFKTYELSARDYLPVNGKDYIENSSNILQWQINYGTLISQTEAILKNDKDNLFFSRCAIDRLAYSIALNVGQDTRELTIKDINNLKYFKQVFYIPIEFPLVDNDDVRGTNIHMQSKVNNAILNLLEHYDIPHVIVKGTIKERLEIIKNNL